MECPYCKAENRDGVRYCGNCGKLMNPVPNPTATSASSNTPASINSGSGGSGGSRSLNPGSRLQGGRYVIKKVLGQGGMGAALLATDNRLDGKSVVIKELLSDNTDPTKLQDDVRNFRREVATLAHIDHPLVPNVTDHFQEGSRYFMVQEYVEGENLEDRMDRTNQPMKERDVLGYASEVLDILDYLAQQTPPIVHRDIKPANIIIGTKDKRAHLVDFGIARADVARNAHKKQTSALGTPGYAPPEQYQGNADPRSDLYALAATLHHLLTNRDPRNHSPFTYPPSRTLNPQLSPEVERVLTRALSNDINQRYQSALAMKRDVDDILLKRFGVSGNISSYTLGTSGPMAAINVPPTIKSGAPTIASGAPTIASGAPTIPSGPTWVGSQQQAQPPVQRPPAYPPPFNPVPPPPQKKSHLGRNLFLLILVIVFIAAVIIGVPILNSRLSHSGTTATPGTATTGSTPTATTPYPANGIGAFKAADGELIGVSDGTVAFDTTRTDGASKQQAADKLKAGDPASAESLWQAGLSGDTNDAEALIYLEDQRVLASGSPYITIVIGTMLSGNGLAGVGRDDLQGAYVAQKEFNDGQKLGSVRVRLLIANSGGDATYATTIANQIVQAVKSDKTIVGVMGWPYSSRTLNAIRILASAHIPMVSQTASSDQLTGISPYFFRVAPSNKSQAVIGAKYAEQTLNAHSVVLFVDPADSYSQSLATDFSNQFKNDGNTIVATENYTVGNAASITRGLQEALTHKFDVLYFSGYSTDVSTLLTNLPNTGLYAQLPVLGGDALYELGGYQPSSRANFNRLHFTAFAYPDEWDILGLTAQKPAFFTDYPNAFDPNRKNQGSPYGYTRATNDTLLSFDGMLALLTAAKTALAGGTQLSSSDLQLALTKINVSQPIQGVSGRIAFDSNGDPIDKAVVMLSVDQQGHIKLDSIKGTFLV